MCVMSSAGIGNIGIGIGIGNIGIGNIGIGIGLQAGQLNQPSGLGSEVKRDQTYLL